MDTVAPRIGGDMKLPALFKRGRSGTNGPSVIDLYLNSLRCEGTRKAYGRSLDTVARILSNGRRDARSFPWKNLKYRDDQRLLAGLNHGMAPATANLCITVYRRFMRSLRRAGVVTAERLEVVREMENIPHQVMPAGREVPASEIDRILLHCASKRTPKGVRDAALVALLYGTGMRRQEAVNLQLADYRPGQEPEVIVRGGKGRKDRGMDLKPELQARVAAWLELRGMTPGPLFCPVSNGGYVYVGKLHPQTVTDIMREIAVELGLVRFTPHDLRRSLATHLMDAGHPIPLVAEIMGHSNVKVTGRYYRSNVRKKREASYSLPGGGS